VLGEDVEIPNGVIEATQNLYDALSGANRVKRAEEEYEGGNEHARKRFKTE
jgi:pyruvate/2-oxoglutarate/acetoin dehydrogenase E1 component